MLISSPIVVADTETTSGNVEEAQVVEIATALLNKDLYIQSVYQTLVNPQEPIPPSASAVHHIIDADVLDAPLMASLPLAEMYDNDVVFVAHNAPYDRAMLPVWQEHRWLCTLRLARHLLPEQPSHALQTLRYALQLRPMVPSGALMHRAEADVMVTIELLKYLLNVFASSHGTSPSLVDLNEVIALSEQPILYSKMPFGKHRGELIKDVPRSYMRWALDNMDKLDNDLRYTFEYHLKSRGGRS